MSLTLRLPITGEYIPPKERKALHNQVRADAGEKCIRCQHPDDVETGHVLTVHHFDGNKSNNSWWNLMALCQRCHLKVQTRVNPDIPYFLEHSEWAKPYVAGSYAADDAYEYADYAYKYADFASYTAFAAEVASQRKVYRNQLLAVFMEIAAIND